METVEIDKCTDEKTLGAIGYQCVLNIENAQRIIAEQSNIRAAVDKLIMQLVQERKAENGAEKRENA